MVRKGGAEKKIRSAVAAQSRDELRGRANQDAEEVIGRLDGQLEAMKNTVSTALSNEVETIRIQVDAALKEKTAGEARVLEAKKELGTYTEELESINESLDALIHRVVA